MTFAHDCSAAADERLKQWIEDRLQRNEAITKPEPVAETGATSEEVHSLLLLFNSVGRIIKDPEGPVHGDKVRWISKPK